MVAYKVLGNCTSNLPIAPPVPEDVGGLNLVIEEKHVPNTASPTVWGQSMWLINHLGSLYAPEVIPNCKKDKYWGFIDGLPEMLPCKDCSQHARHFVEHSRPYKDSICSSRENLFKFFVDFHNYVNQRQGKPLLGYDEAYNMFRNGATVKTVRF
jgi:Erv1 / Alr family